MTTVREIESFLMERAPYYMKEDFDNVGLLVGRGGAEVHRVLTSLDVTGTVIDEALERGAELIVAHHPITFGLKSVTDGDPTGRNIIKLLSNGISAICMHTNLDSAPGGVNDALMARLGAKVSGVLDGGRPSELGDYGLGRWGTLSAPEPLSEFLTRVKRALSAGGLRYHDAGRAVSRLAVCGGSGGEFLEKAFELGCDTYLTADVKYDRFLTAAELGINLIDAGHFCTENPVVPVLTALLRGRFPELEVTISARHSQTDTYFV